MHGRGRGAHKASAPPGDDASTSQSSTVEAQAILTTGSYASAGKGTAAVISKLVSKLKDKASSTVPSKVSAAVEKMRDALRKQAKLPGILRDDPDKIKPLTLDLEDGILYIKNPESFADDVRMTFVWTLADLNRMTITEQGEEISAKVVAASDNAKDYFKGFLTELESDEPIKTCKIKSETFFQQGRKDCRKEIARFMLNEFDIPQVFQKDDEFAEKTKARRNLFDSYLDNFHSEKDINTNIKAAAHRLVNIFLEIHKDKLKERFYLSGFAKNFDEIKAMHQHTRKEKVGRKGNTITKVIVPPVKPTELVGIRGVEKGMIREMYHGPWDRMAKLYEEFRQLTASQHWTAEALVDLSSRIKECVTEQHKASDNLRAALKSRRALAPSKKIAEQREWFKAELSQPYHLKEYVKGWEVAQLLPETLTIPSTGLNEGSKMEMSYPRAIYMAEPQIIANAFPETSRFLEAYKQDAPRLNWGEEAQSEEADENS